MGEQKSSGANNPDSRRELTLRRPNCEGCIERCVHSLDSPFNDACMFADRVPMTGLDDHIAARDKMQLTDEILEII
jgi:hypothetical protein